LWSSISDGQLDAKPFNLESRDKRKRDEGIVLGLLRLQTQLCTN
jgi:hypothetical protein